MSSIAYENGFFWKTLWNLSQNAALKAQRKNPNVLLTGDTVHIPDLTIRQESGATEQRHKFVLKGVPEFLRFKVLDPNHKPRPNLDYVIVIEGNSTKGKTDGNGELKIPIPPNAMTGKLMYAAYKATDETGKPVPGRPQMQVTVLQLGNLDPISEVSGFKARLANLGYYKGPIDNNMDDRTTRSITAFQKKKNLPVSGVADDATKSLLQSLHGH